MTAGPAIEIADLHVQVDGGEVSGLSLVVARGESVALVGAQQRLLTAIVRVCGGLDPVQRGRVRVDGVDMGDANRSELLRLRSRVGYVSVGGGLFANMTLLDNLTLPLRYRGMSDAEATQRARKLLQQTHLDELADRRAASVSVELQKLAAYARALASEPSVVLVEDPAAHLNPDGRAVVEALHARLRARGASVLVADDDRELAGRLSDRLVDLDVAGPTGMTVVPATRGAAS